MCVDGQTAAAAVTWLSDNHDSCLGKGEEYAATCVSVWVTLVCVGDAYVRVCTSGRRSCACVWMVTMASAVNKIMVTVSVELF